MGRRLGDDLHAVRRFPMIHHIALAGVEGIAQDFGANLADRSGKAVKAIRELDWFRARIEREEAERLSVGRSAGEEVQGVVGMLKSQRDWLGVASVEQIGQASCR